MERIVPIDEDKKITPKRVPKDVNAEKLAGGTLADILVCILTGISAVIGLGYSILFFTRFLENDTHLWGVLSAFVLCFGLGAFAYIPAAFMSFIGWRAHKKGRIFRDLVWAVVLTGPWVLLSAVLVFLSDLPKLYSVPILLLTTVILAWVVISMRRKS